MGDEAEARINRMISLPTEKQLTEVMTTRSLGNLKIRRVSQDVTTVDMLVYGPPKLGKTTFALTAQDVPEMGPYVHIAVEKGEETIRDTYPDTAVLRVREDDNGNILHSATARWNRFQDFYDELARPGHGFGTVCIDTLDVLQEVNIGAIMEDTDAVKEGKQDPDVPSMREYGRSRTQMKRVIRMFQDLPMNVIWICHSKDDQNERTKKWSKKPALVGQLQDEVGGMVNNLLYLTIEPGPRRGDDPVRLLVTSADGEISAGTRSRVVNDMGEIIDPTMAKLWYPLTGTTK
jgi:hypothetical protein